MGNAVAAAAEVVKLEPTFSVTTYLATQHDKPETDRRRHEAGLLKAGLPADFCGDHIVMAEFSTLSRWWDCKRLTVRSWLA